MGDDSSFAGYRWSYFSSLSDGPLRSRAQRFLESIDWASLVQHASAKRNLHCQLLPDIGLGYNHMVRVLEFADHQRWVARLRMPPLAESGDEGAIMQSEYMTIHLVQSKTNTPVPRVHMFEPDPSSVGAQFMLMDGLRGNVGMDLSFSIPPAHKLEVYARIAEVQISLFNIRLPKIGKVIGVNEDGTYLQGPLPNLGGPFDTAAEFFRAWSSKAQFGLSEDKLRDAAGSYADEILTSISNFKKWVHDNAELISVNNTGPFPLYHGDFGHNNIIFDDKYQLLGVIDWEMAFAAPFELACEFPLSLSIVPPAMDVPWKYEAGTPKEPEDQQRFGDRANYIALVRQREEERGLAKGYTLSSTLEDSRRQYVATAMRLYQSGKAGWYSKVVDGFK